MARDRGNVVFDNTADILCLESAIQQESGELIQETVSVVQESEFPIPIGRRGELAAREAGSSAAWELGMFGSSGGRAGGSPKNGII